MLRRLSIQDFVIVTALDMEFEAGLTVFSGETGAGKSILIDALSLLCGARAEADVIRAGCARAQLTAMAVRARSSTARRWRSHNCVKSALFWSIFTASTRISRCCARRCSAR